MPAPLCIFFYALIDIIIKVDQNKVYRHYAYKSLFEYVTCYLGLSEATAYNFITVSRKSITVPELKQAINNGEITLTKARKITPVITPQNKTEWLTMAKILPQQKLEKEIAKANPKLTTPERVMYKTERRLSVSFGVEKSVYEKFKKVKDIVSQKKRHTAGLDEVFEEMVMLYLEKHDPIEKAKRAKVRNEKIELKRMENQSNETHKKAFAKNHGRKLDKGHKQSLIQKSAQESGHFSKPASTHDQTPDQKNHPSPVLSTGKVRINISAHIKHAIIVRDQNQCTHTDQNGKRCGDKRWLDVHHIKTVKNGGTNVLSNLRLLCNGHHKLEHI